MTHPIDLILPRLQGARRSGAGYIALCPAHQDRRPSLSLRETEDRRILLHCFAGCTFQAIVGRLGLNPGDLFGDARGPEHAWRSKRNAQSAKPELSREQRLKQALERWRDRRLGEVTGELRDNEERQACVRELIAARMTLLRYGRKVPSLSGKLAEFDRLRLREAELEDKLTFLNAPSTGVLYELWQEEAEGG